MFFFFLFFFFFEIQILTCWKSTAVFHLVKLDPVKSAEPPTKSGITLDKAVNTPSESLRVATAASAGVNLGKAASQPSGNFPLKRRSISEASLGYSCLYLAKRAFQSASALAP